MQLNDILADAQDQDRGRDFELADPGTGKPTGITLRIAGPDSATQGRARLQFADELAEAMDADGGRSARHLAVHQADPQPGAANDCPPEGPLVMARLEKVLCATLEALLAGRKSRLPDAGLDILDAFLALHRARTYHGNGPNPITWEAMAAWSQMMCRPIPPHHAQIIMALDNVWMKDAALRMGVQVAGVQAAPMVSKTPLSAGLFDAMTGG